MSTVDSRLEVEKQEYWFQRGQTAPLTAYRKNSLLMALFFEMFGLSDRWIYAHLTYMFGES
jgi:hypothetical protein